MNETVSNHGQAEEIIEVDIAGAGGRIAAYLLNILFTLLAYVPLVIAFLPFFNAGAMQNPESLAKVDWNLSLLFGGLAVLLVYAVAQLWLMAKSGQSLGKKIMKIRVLKSNGSNPGFVGTVMLREVLFNVIVSVVSMIAAYLAVLALGKDAAAADFIGNALSLLPWLVCLVMLFNKTKNRRTLQDLLADTVVVRLPDNRR